MRNLVRAAVALTFTAGAVLATGAGAQAGAPDTRDAQDAYAGCQSGYVCIYPGASWNGNRPEATYYQYGVYNLSNQTGTHRVFNNQTGGASVQLCTGYNGVGCGAKMPTWTYWDVDLTPINSIKLSA
ncbi:hypothetical protein EES43_11235 [Streptomyces sp. ADI96-02]|uniref:hypothetical protein n=1 Tax=unclassified Streptomyces TaxID=2593676 RepID=UPI000F551DB0|nr:hypothetical protein [Streptomyces sp. ADI96-02]RPK63581.1 hypothetical protein EES43_11235 [Streptomyces sp. ADI96-02]